MPNYNVDVGTLISRLAKVLAPVVMLFTGVYTLHSDLLWLTQPNAVDLMLAGKIILWSQCIIVALFLAIPPHVPSDIPESMKSDVRYSNAVQAARQFCVYWFWIWVALFVFYLVQAYEWPKIMLKSSDAWAPYAEGVSYLGSTTFMLLCYFTLVIRIVNVDPAEWHHILFWTVLTSVAMILIGLAGNGVLPGFPVQDNALLADVLKVIPSFFCGVVLALLVGRLEGQFLGTSRWIVILLYVYALLQIVFVEPSPGNEDANARFLTVVVFALLLKCLLFWEFLRIIRSGTLIYYMYEYRKLLDENATNRETFLQILHGKSGRGLSPPLYENDDLTG